MVDIGRLNVVLSADASQVQQASRTAQEGLKQVEQQAQATGAQIDALATKMAKAQGGTVDQWRGILEKTAPSAQAVEAALGGSAVAATKAATETGKVASATAQAGTAAGLMAQHFDLSAGTLIRSAGALVGVGLGLSAAVGLAQQLHSAFVGMLDGQLAWESSLRRTAALYGDAASGIIAASAAQSALPGTLGTQAEFLQANLNARFLTTRYGVPQSEVTDLTTAAGRVAGVFGLNDPKARADLQARTLAAASEGGSQLRGTGLELDPLSVARRLGYAAPEALGALTPGQLDRARTLMIEEHDNRLAATATGEGSLLGGRTALEKQLEQAQNAMQTMGAGGFAEQMTASLSGEAGGYASYQYEQNKEAIAAATEALRKNTEELGTAQSKADEAAKKLEALGVSAGSATAKMLSWAGSLENPYSIARGQVAATGLAAVAASMVGPSPLYAKSASELAATANAQAYGQAFQSYQAGDAQKAPNGVLAYLQEQADQQGPGLEDQRARANAAIAEAQRRATGSLLGLQAGQASDLAGRAQTEASASLQTIQIAQDTRRLDVAEKLAGYRKQALDVESKMAPLLLAQANLADRIEVASRDNLATRKQVIAAEQAALPASNALEDLDYQQKRLELQAQARQSRLIQGKSVADLPSFDTLISQHVQGQLDRPDKELAALDANRPVQLAQRTQTAEGLTRASALADLEGQGRALRDQMIPLEQAQRLTQAKEDSVQRTLALMDLEDTKAIAAASRDLNAASLVRIQADATARAAEDYANGLDLGATAAERGQAALEKARDALKEMGAMQGQANEANARIANGLGAGGLGPSTGATGSITVPITIVASDTETIIHNVLIEVETRLRAELGGSGASAPPVSSNLAGARR